MGLVTLIDTSSDTNMIRRNYYPRHEKTALIHFLYPFIYPLPYNARGSQRKAFIITFQNFIRPPRAYHLNKAMTDGQKIQRFISDIWRLIEHIGLRNKVSFRFSLQKIQSQYFETDPQFEISYELRCGVKALSSFSYFYLFVKIFFVFFSLQTSQTTLIESSFLFLFFSCECRYNKSFFLTF